MLVVLQAGHLGICNQLSFSDFIGVLGSNLAASMTGGEDVRHPIQRFGGGFEADVDSEKVFFELYFDAGFLQRFAASAILEILIRQDTPRRSAIQPWGIKRLGDEYLLIVLPYNI